VGSQERITVHRRQAAGRVGADTQCEERMSPMQKMKGKSGRSVEDPGLGGPRTASVRSPLRCRSGPPLEPWSISDREPRRRGPLWAALVAARAGGGGGRAARHRVSPALSPGSGTLAQGLAAAELGAGGEEDQEERTRAALRKGGRDRAPRRRGRARSDGADRDRGGRSAGRRGRPLGAGRRQWGPGRQAVSRRKTRIPKASARGGNG